MIDVVVVAYRSRRHLRQCVEPLEHDPDLHVIVVDNACPERSCELLDGLSVEILPMGRNAGFGPACNAGAGRGSGQSILFLNPDATISPESVRSLAAHLERNRTCGVVGPHIFEVNGETQLSMRRAPRLGSAFAEAVFLHHALPRAAWASEIVRDGYESPAEVEWLSGAVLCVRRSAFIEVGGFDERFFLYSEDADLCARLRAAGYGVQYRPEATAVHEGGGSAPRPQQAAQKVEGRLLYARLHAGRTAYLVTRLVCVLNELVRVPIAATRSRSHLRGRLAGLSAALAPTHWAREPA
ncbi:MAG: hypothetical protein C5B48_00955 [Candidatus Rokuibacteriota bacterium]|nr:MAG: hypothetical protein C5B48_00955 [Candidatus Rokubacteria bacterium]